MRLSDFLRSVLTLVLVGATLNLFVETKCDASITIAAVSVSTPSGPDPSGWGSHHLIDQSGLSANYVSGVTDFATFVASTTATYSFPWTTATALGGSAGATPDFIFDLGSVYSVDGAHLWNQAGSASIVNYDFFGSLDGVTYSFLGNGTFAPQGITTPGATSTWMAGSARYIKISNTTNDGFADATRFNEIVFSGSGVSTIPEPGTLAIWSVLGLAAAGLRRRKS